MGGKAGKVFILFIVSFLLKVYSLSIESDNKNDCHDKAFSSN